MPVPVSRSWIGSRCGDALRDGIATIHRVAGESNRASRPFWLHQAVEYVIGAVFISTSIQSETPALPAGLGVAIMLNAAFTRGPAGAFRVLHRQVHRVIDVVIIAAIALAAVQPWIPLGDNARLLMGVLAFVLGFVWWNTNFATREERKKAARATAGERASSEEIGQAAGRMMGKGVNFVRRKKDDYDQSRQSDDESSD